MSLAGLEGHLKDLVPQPVPIQAVDGHGGLLVVGHGDEAETFTLVGVEVSDDFDVDDGTKRAEELPQDGLVGLLAQIVDEDTPTRRRVPR